MTRADYNSIIYAYESLALEIDAIMDDPTPAMEADAPVGSGTAPSGGTSQTQSSPGTPSAGPTGTKQSVTPNGQKPDEINAKKAMTDTVKSDEKNQSDKFSKYQKVMNKLKQILKKIGQIIENLKRVLTNRFRLMLESDRGFQRLYNKQKQTIQPYEKVSVVNYSYENAKLEGPMKSLMGDINASLAALSLTQPGSSPNGRVSEILEAESGKMLEALFRPYTKDAQDSVTNGAEFVKYMVNSYRGEKAERVYSSDQLGAIEKNALACREISNRCNAYMRDCEASYHRIRALQNQLSPQADEKEIEMVQRNAKKAAILYNTWNSIVHMYYEVRLEQSMNYRIILKRFYQM